MVRGGYTQAALGFSRAASKLLVNGRSNKMVNIASIKMMKKNFSLISSIVMPETSLGMTPSVLRFGLRQSLYA